MERLLITGAAGGLGSMVRRELTHLAPKIRLSDQVDLGVAADHEELVICNLTDKDAVDELVAGCDGIVHFGGRSIKDTWEIIRDSNMEGVFNLYEAARKHGHPRIVFASSNHVTGYHPQTEKLDALSPTRPDSLYAVSKVFGESLARLYYDKFGQETASIRIGSCLPEPLTHRMLATWMSPGDMVRLINCIFKAPKLGCPIIYGASDNDASWWSNGLVSYLGWRPKDNSETFREKLDATLPQPAADASDVLWQGGVFTEHGIETTPTKGP